RTCARVSRTAARSSSEPYQYVLFRALPQDEQPPANRLVQRNPRLRVRGPAVVHIYAAGLDEAAGLALRRRQLNARKQIDETEPVRAEIAARHLARWHVCKHREHIVDRQRRHIFG